jgi:hypothetical protein
MLWKRIDGGVSDAHCSRLWRNGRENEAIRNWLATQRSGTRAASGYIRHLASKKWAEAFTS